MTSARGSKSYTDNDTSSCTINNGFTSDAFELKRGVRQGCPLSGLLFIIAVELLSSAIRSSKEIKGIQVMEKEIKLSQYADDTTTFCADVNALHKLLAIELLDVFKDCSGLKLDSTKSETLWLGKGASRKDEFGGVQWPQRPISALGVSFSYETMLCEKENFDRKINNIQNLLNLWCLRDLSLCGRITIAKTLGLSKIVFASCCLHTPQYVAAAVNKMVHDFVWNNKPAKIKRDTLIGSKAVEGG